MPRTAAVFFDVDFTLIHPGPRFQAEGYEASCARYGITVDCARFEEAVAGAAHLLASDTHLYDREIFVKYTARIVELMGGTGPHVDRVAREVYADWAEHQHFILYDDVRDVLMALKSLEIRVGLISNSHRPLESFEAHFDLDGLIAVTVSSSEHGFLKPHPSIFQAALDRMKVPASESVMVGDSLTHDVLGARDVGMRPVLLSRRGDPPDDAHGLPVIRSLGELPGLLVAHG